MINNKNFKDNKDKRLSVVIFSEIIDGKGVVCTCPFTNSVGTAYRNPTEYYSNAFLVLGGLIGRQYAPRLRRTRSS